MFAALLALLVILAPAGVFAGNHVTGTAESLSSVLPGNAYFMSTGPSAAADIEFRVDGANDGALMRGATCLRVTLFTCEGLHSVWVERLLINRAGGTHSESCYSFSLSGPESPCPQGIGRTAPREITWLDENTFALSLESATPSADRQFPIRVTVHCVDDGEFELICESEGG